MKGCIAFENKVPLVHYPTNSVWNSKHLIKNTFEEATMPFQLASASLSSFIPIMFHRTCNRMIHIASAIPSLIGYIWKGKPIELIMCCKTSKCISLQIMHCGKKMFWGNYYSSLAYCARNLLKTSLIKRKYAR